MIVIDILTVLDGSPVEELCRQEIDHHGAEEALLKRTNKTGFQKLLGDEKARVAVSVHNTIGGPHFSSVNVRVQAEITCSQNKDTMKRARDFLFDENIELLDSYIEPAYLNLIEHLRQLGLDKENGT